MVSVCLIVDCLVVKLFKIVVVWVVLLLLLSSIIVCVSGWLLFVALFYVYCWICGIIVDFNCVFFSNVMVKMFVIVFVSGDFGVLRIRLLLILWVFFLEKFLVLVLCWVIVLFNFFNNVLYGKFIFCVYVSISVWCNNGMLFVCFV